MPLPKRVIDVGPPDGSQPLRLYPGKGLQDIYFTLSYRWNQQRANEFTTVKSNITAYYFNIPFENLPQVMKDAIHITRRFGVRFLWIDALCIMQDDEEDWISQANDMARIYRDSTLTIAAAGHEIDGWAGCFRPRSGQSVRPVYCEKEWPDGSPVYIFADRTTTGGGIRPESILDTRAWILQEQLLSPRVLTYSDRELFWECATINASETFPAGIPTFYDTDLRQRDLRVFKEAMRREYASLRPLPRESDRLRFYHYWRKVVENYSARDITKDGDKLMALAGIAKGAAKLLDDRLVVGLWKRQILAGAALVGQGPQ